MTWLAGPIAGLRAGTTPLTLPVPCYAVRMILSQSVRCPYCGERFESVIDVSAGGQQYTEDCQVCCRPIVFNTEVGYDGQLLSIEIRREDD